MLPKSFAFKKNIKTQVYTIDEIIMLRTSLYFKVKLMSVAQSGPLVSIFIVPFMFMQTSEHGHNLEIAVPLYVQAHLGQQKVSYLLILA